MEDLKYIWNELSRAELMAYKERRVGGEGSVKGKREELTGGKETIGEMPQCSPFHHSGKVNARRHHEHCKHQK